MAREVRHNFAKQLRTNYHSLVAMDEFELDLMRGMHKYGILDDRIDQMQAMFEAIDIEGGPDGKISFDEIIRAADNTKVFVKPAKPGDKSDQKKQVVEGTPESEELEPEVTLDELRSVLSKVDITGDESLDQVEFMLLSMDRAFIFSRENLERLYMMWDLDRHGRCRVLDTVRTLFANKDGSE